MAALSNATKGSLSTIAAFICVGAGLCLLVATIVLSLIPIYLSQRTATTVSAISNEFTAYTVIGATPESRKRRAISETNAEHLIGATVTDTGSIAAVKTMYKNILAGHQHITDITVQICYIASVNSGKRKRRTLWKRQSDSYLFACNMRLIFEKPMSDREKNLRGPVIQDTLRQGLQPGKVTWPSLTFTKDGVESTFKPRHLGFYYCSTIGAPGKNNDGKNTLATIASTTATTTESHTESTATALHTESTATESHTESTATASHTESTATASHTEPITTAVPTTLGPDG